MYFVVALQLKNNVQKNVWIPSHWCMGFNMESVYNFGVQKNQNLVIFYSRHKNRVPKFDLKISDEFVEEDACYIGRYKKCKGK